jgi:hypothetical protein
MDFDTATYSVAFLLAVPFVILILALLMRMIAKVLR